MDEGVKKLQQDLCHVEYDAELLLLARKELVDSDRLRNSNREALTALRKIAKTSQSSVPELGNNLESSLKDRNGKECRTCGNYDQSEPVWFLCSGSDFFLNMPFHQAHLKLETDQSQLELSVKRLQSKVKEKTLHLSEKGALVDKIGPNLLKAFVTLKDEH